MRFTDRWIKPDGSYQKSQAYKIRANRTVIFTEKQEDGSCDTVQLDFLLNEQQEAIFSEEYKPANVDECKKIDLTAIVYQLIPGTKDIDSETPFTIYLYDVKDSVRGNEMIFHLIEQWRAGIQNALDFTRYAEENHYHIGVITRNYDSEWLAKQIEVYRSQTERYKKQEHLPRLVRAKSGAQQLRVKEQLKVLEEFQNRTFRYRKQQYYYNYRQLDQEHFYKFVLKAD